MAEEFDDGWVRARDPRRRPGGRAAIDLGCICSVLANAAYRAGAPGERPFVEPQCPVHAVTR